MANDITSKKVAARTGLLLAGSVFFLLAGLAVISFGAILHSEIQPGIAVLLEQPLSLLKVAVSLLV